MYTIEVSHLAKRFGQTQAVVDVSFAVEPGEIFGLLGPNGAGKTTTIRMMLDIFKPDAGTVKVFEGALDLARKRRVGYMPEERGLYKDQKLEPTLIYLATLKGMDEGLSTDLLASHIRDAVFHLGTITGEITTDEILGNIFGKFCIGK